MPEPTLPSDAYRRPAGARRHRVLVIVLAIVAIAVAAVVIALLASGGASTSRVATLPPLKQPVGPESILDPSVGEIDADPAGFLDQAKRLGVTKVDYYVFWASIAPDPTLPTAPRFNAADPAAYPAANWVSLDAIMRDARARGIEVELALNPPPPLWAAGRGAPDPASHPYWRPSPRDYGEFVRAVATRYSGHYTPPGASQPLPRAHSWSIWNEPNLGIFLAPETTHHSKVEVSGVLYRRLLDAAWTALRDTGHARDEILIGETAPAGATFRNAPGLFSNMAPLRFLRALYCVDSAYRQLRGSAAALRGCPTTAAASGRFASQHPALFHATGFADHPYPQGLPPNTATPDEPDYAELAEIPRLERVLDTLQRVYGSPTRLPIYSTEFGYQTKPPDPEPGTVSPAVAAMYLNWAEYLTWRDPRIKSYDQYLVLDPPNGIFASGLKTNAGVPKPGFYAFRMPIFLPATTTNQGHPLEVWGCVRPFYYARHQTHRPQQVLIQFRPSGGQSFTTVKAVPLTDRYGYVDVLARFPGSGTVRLAWSYPHGPQIFSRAVSITLR